MHLLKKPILDQGGCEMRKSLMLLTAAAIVVTIPVAANAGDKGGGSNSATQVTHQAFTFTKQQDTAAPNLYAGLHKGTHFPKMTIRVAGHEVTCRGREWRGVGYAGCAQDG
jgi:hypothetical protein